MRPHRCDQLDLGDSRVIVLEHGDVTRVATDAIVNAANSQLARGGGVCGAIHAAGGPQIALECGEWIRTHGEVTPGHAAITSGGRLPARHVIHAVGPVWHGGTSGEPELLARAYRSSMQLAEEHRLRSIAFPSISTGIFGFPADRAAPIALDTLAQALRSSTYVVEARMVLFDASTYETYAEALGALA